MDIPCSPSSLASDKLMLKAMRLPFVLILTRVDPSDFGMVFNDIVTDHEKRRKYSHFLYELVYHI